MWNHILKFLATFVTEERAFNFLTLGLGIAAHIQAGQENPTLTAILAELRGLRTDVTQNFDVSNELQRRRAQGKLSV